MQFLLDYSSEGDHTLCSLPDADGAVPAHYAAMTGSKEILLLLKTKVVHSQTNSNHIEGGFSVGTIIIREGFL